MQEFWFVELFVKISDSQPLIKCNSDLLEKCSSRVEICVNELVCFVHALKLRAKFREFPEQHASQRIGIHNA